MKYWVILGAIHLKVKGCLFYSHTSPLKKEAGTMSNISGQSLIKRFTSSIQTRFETPEIFSNRYIETVIIQRIIFIVLLPILLAPRKANFMLAYIFINLSYSNMSIRNTNAQLKVALKILTIHSFQSTNKHLTFKNYL
jgi:hypothetical protein